MKGIQRHGKDWLVQLRRDGRLRKWTYDTFKEAQRKRDKVFGYLLKVIPSMTLIIDQYFQTPLTHSLAETCVLTHLGHHLMNEQQSTRTFQRLSYREREVHFLE